MIIDVFGTLNEGDDWKNVSGKGKKTSKMEHKLLVRCCSCVIITSIAYGLAYSLRSNFWCCLTLKNILYILKKD
jgi:hypothetical protein